MLYDNVDHSEFVTDWMRKVDRDNRRRLFVPEALSGSVSLAASFADDKRWRELPSHVRDVLKVIFHVTGPLATEREIRTGGKTEKRKAEEEKEEEGRGMVEETKKRREGDTENKNHNHNSTLKG